MKKIILIALLLAGVGAMLAWLTFDSVFAAVGVCCSIAATIWGVYMNVSKKPKPH